FAFDVVEVQRGDESQCIADLFAAAGEALDVVPSRGHAFVGDIAEPAAEDREPVAVAHAHTPVPPRPEGALAAASAPSGRGGTLTRLAKYSTSSAYGSNPTTFTASATKFDIALMS